MSFCRYGSAAMVTTDGLVSVGPGASTATAAAFNTLIGAGAGAGIVSGGSNVAVGYHADVGATAGRSTVVGANATVSASSGTAGSIAIGYGATAGASNVCVIGGSGDAVTVVEYGPHLRFHSTMYREEDVNYGGGDFTISAAEVIDGATFVVGLRNNIFQPANYYCTTASAAQVIAALPSDVKVGTAWYFKVGVYDSSRTALTLNLYFGAGWTRLGFADANQFIPTLLRSSGCKVFLCVITQITPTPAITAICTLGPT